MLTRIEIDGFKTFRKFGLDIPPFLVIVGRNASGKSNLFDAIQFLRRMADGTLMEASSQSRGELDEIFHRRVDGSRVDTMTFAAETLLDREVTDDFGDEVPVRHSRLRYEVTLEVRRANGASSKNRASSRERLFVLREAVSLIRQPKDAWVQRHVSNPRERRNLVNYSSRNVDILLETTRDDNGRRVFAIHQEGRAGKPKLLPATDAVATVLSTLTTAQDYPLLYALKRELMSWGLVHLDPASLRRVSSFDDDDQLSPSGNNLANALHRIALDTSTDDRPEGVLAEISADLARIIPEVRSLRIEEDRERRQRQVSVITRDDAPHSARVASDGTLRALALLTALYDPASDGLICFEEPENGVFPKRLVAFVQHLKVLVERAFHRRLDDPDAPARQLILSSHSPVIVRALQQRDPDAGGQQVRGDVVFIDNATRTDKSGRSRVTRARFIRVNAQLPISDEYIGQIVGRSEIEDFEVTEALS